MKVDSAVSRLVEQPEVIVIKDVKPAGELFHLELDSNSCFYALIRTDSKGHILNNVVRDEVSAESFTDASKRDWFMAPQKDHRGYYGPIVKVQNHYCLVWSRPIMASSVLGSKKFCGTVAVLVNLAECLHQFETAYSKPFDLLYKGKSLYNSSWNASDTLWEEEPVSMMGITDFALRYRARSKSADSLSYAASGLTKENKGPSLLASEAAPDHGPLPVLPLVLIITLLVAVTAIALLFVNHRRKWASEIVAPAELVTDVTPVVEGGDVRQAAVAQVFSDIKTQIEKQERKKIEREVKKEYIDKIREDVKTQESERFRQLKQ